jgi:dTDP-D-glucose 4,6-dehydratase
MYAVDVCVVQVVVLDKLDYCSSVKNFDAMKDCPNFKVRDPTFCANLRPVELAEDKGGAVHFAISNVRRVASHLLLCPETTLNVG